VKTLSLRGIDDEMADALKNKAQEAGTSINKTVLDLIRESVGLKKKKPTRVHHDIDELAGTWSEKDEQEFKKKTQFFHEIDEEIWS
jgi:hypothetical protein